MTCAYLSDAAIETQASDLLAAYGRLYGPILKPPIPIDFIVEDVCDLVIDWTDEDPFDNVPDNDRVLAAIRITRTHRALLMNERQRSFFDQFLGTMEYSKAHEVGHAVLHLATPPALQHRLLFPEDGIVLCRGRGYDRREFQAERFAGYLLMPEHLVHAAVGPRAINSWPQIYDLALQFKVSPTAMRKRLEQLDLAFVDDRNRVFPNRAAATGQMSIFAPN